MYCNVRQCFCVLRTHRSLEAYCETLWWRWLIFSSFFLIMKLTGENQSTWGKTCPSATLSTTNPTWTDAGSNPGLRGERPATNRLSHGTALRQCSFRSVVHCVETEREKRLSVVTFFFFAWWRAPQQMLRTHHSLKAFCATLWWRWAILYQVLQVMEHQWNEIDRGKRTTRRKTCPSATLSTTNPKWTDPGSNPGIRGERPATNRLRHGTAFRCNLTFYTTLKISRIRITGTRDAYLLTSFACLLPRIIIPCFHTGLFEQNFWVIFVKWCIGSTGINIQFAYQHLVFIFP
jgi:hypothetical protein